MYLWPARLSLFASHTQTVVRGAEDEGGGSAGY